MRRSCAAVLPAVLLLAAAFLSCAGPGASGRTPARTHRPVDPGADCAECHAKATPAAVEAWNGSAHGVALVKCVVCHGSTGADFTLVPEPSRCAACHPSEVAGAAEAPKASGCFSCHAAHSLAAAGKPNPHQK